MAQRVGKLNMPASSLGLQKALRPSELERGLGMFRLQKALHGRSVRCRVAPAGPASPTSGLPTELKEALSSASKHNAKPKLSMVSLGCPKNTVDGTLPAQPSEKRCFFSLLSFEETWHLFPQPQAGKRLDFPGRS